jgi:cytochrome c peroxidase
MIRRTLMTVALTGMGFFTGAAVAADDPFASFKQYFEPIPAHAPIPADNSMTIEKIELGKMLFFDARLSGSGVISCATCHNPALGYTDRIPRAIGHGAQIGPRNTPTALNAAFLSSQFWDGRAATLEEQALGPLQADIEHNITLEDAIKVINTFPEYKDRFKEAFGGENAVTADNLAKAIASFERTLITPNSPFDRYLAGDVQAISAEAKRGMKAFVERGCVACHRGPALSDGQFHRIQVPGSTDLGRYLVTKNEADKHAFRTPTLRNIALTYPYFNNGGVATLEEAVKIMGKEMLKLDLPKQEVSDLVAFLDSLTGEMPKFAIPALP